MEGDIECEDFRENLENFLSRLEAIAEITSRDGAPVDNTNWNGKVNIRPYNNSLDREYVKQEVRDAARDCKIRPLKFRIVYE